MGRTGHINEVVHTVTHHSQTGESLHNEVFNYALQNDPELYNQSNYKQLQLPFGTKYEHDYIMPMLTSATQDYVRNIQCQLYILKMGERLFPLTVNDAEYENAYVCSPFTRYITYAERELKTITNPWKMRFLSPSLNCFGSVLKLTKINKVACINNWLLSTNLYPNMNALSIKKMTDFMVANFPDHTIMFPSLNRHTNASLMDQLENHGYQLIPSREVFIFDKALKDYENRRVTQSDLHLLKNTTYQVIGHHEIFENDYEKIAELYDLLYMRKYSLCNPFFTKKFISLCHTKNLINFQGLRDKKGDLIGFIGFFKRNNVMATPLLGYDTNLPAHEGLYRMLTALSLIEALKTNITFNMSAGVSEFKMWRGGVGFIEYNAVYHKHLPFQRRIGWNLLHFGMNRFGVPLLQQNNF